MYFNVGRVNPCFYSSSAISVNFSKAIALIGQCGNNQLIRCKKPEAHSVKRPVILDTLSNGAFRVLAENPMWCVMLPLTGNAL